MSAMGQWMRHQGCTEDEVAHYEAYLVASRRKRVFTCLWPQPRRPRRAVVALRGETATVVSPGEYSRALLSGAETASWVIRETATGRVIAETFSARVAAAVNPARYEAVPVLQHLQEFNRAVREGAIGR